MTSPLNTTAQENEIVKIAEQVVPYLWVGLGIVLTVFIALIIRILMRKTVRTKLPTDVYPPIEKAVIYTIVIVGVIASLSPLGISLMGLLVAGGFAGIVLGFATQTVVANLFSGLFLLIERPFKIGDAVKVMNYSGIVEDVSIMSTRVRTWDGVFVRLPNDKVFGGDIANYAKSVARRITIKIGISYDSDIEKAASVIKEMLEEHPYVLINPPPDVLVSDYGDSAIFLEVRAWVPVSMWFQVYTELMRDLKKKLDKAGIVIPYPQLDLHFRNEVKFKKVG